MSAKISVSALWTLSRRQRHVDLHVGRAADLGCLQPATAACCTQDFVSVSALAASQSAGTCTLPRPKALAATVNNATGRPADSPSSTAVSIGWLNAQSLRKKADAINVGITERSLDVMALTETWNTASDDNCLRLAAPPDYAVVEVARTSPRGGGVAIIFRQSWKSHQLPVPACSSFEIVAVRLTTGPSSSSTSTGRAQSVLPRGFSMSCRRFLRHWSFCRVLSSSAAISILLHKTLATTTLVDWPSC